MRERGHSMRHVMAFVGFVAVCAGLVVEPTAAGAAPPLVGFSRSDYPVGIIPTDVASADLDDDGILDLVVVNGHAMSNSVSVFLGNGNGTFAPRTDYPTGEGPESVAAGDVTGDSILDLVIGNVNSDSVSVLPGLGDGTFASRSDFAVGDGPVSLALGDLNGDSILDLVVANINDSTFSSFLGVGNGTFASRSDHSTPFPNAVKLADFNRDSHLDLVAANLYVDTVTVFLGSGPGTFATGVPYAAGVEPFQVSVGDLNGDAVVDLAVPNVGDDTVSLFLGAGDGTFVPTATIALEPASGPSDATLADFNGDTRVDVAIVAGSRDHVTMLLGVGDGTFTSPADFDTGRDPGRIATGDFNADGRLDLVVNNASSDSISVLVNSGIPVLPGPPTNVTAVAGNKSAIVSWTPPTSDGGLPVTGYVVTAFIGDVAQAPVTFDSTATTQTMTGLTNGTSYTFTVAAVTAIGTGPSSSPSNTVTVAATVPDVPIMLRNATAFDQSATISWLAPASDGGSPIIGYAVTAYVGYAPTKVRIFSSTSTTQTVTGLTDGVTYRFKVAAINAVGVGPTSKISNPVIPAPTAPAAPVIGIATAGNGQASVSWTTPASDGGSPITGYVVTAYVDYAPVYVRIFSSTSTTQTITGLTNGTEYRFRVRAYNAVGVGEHSKVTNPVTPSA